MFWSLIHSLHAEAESKDTWNGTYSEVFKVEQGVRQGGIISTDLYKSIMICLADSIYSAWDVTLAKSLV